MPATSPGARKAATAGPGSDIDLIVHVGGDEARRRVELVRKLAVEFDDAQVARILNKQGRRTGPGNPFTKANVCSMRGRHGILRGETKRARDPREGPFTADEAARELGVCMSTVHRWLRVGVLAGRQVTPGAPWQVALSEEVRRRRSGGGGDEDLALRGGLRPVLEEGGADHVAGQALDPIRLVGGDDLRRPHREPRPHPRTGAEELVLDPLDWVHAVTTQIPRPGTTLGPLLRRLLFEDPRDAAGAGDTPRRHVPGRVARASAGSG